MTFMTHDEQAEIRKNTLFEHHEAERELAHMEKKASDIAQAFAAVAAYMAHAADRTSEFSHYHPPTPRGGDLLNLEQALKLASDIEKARQHVRDLLARKKALGLE